MNLHQLRVFLSVYETGSISAAARQLRISQPAASKQLTEFESVVGAPLFDRLPRGIRPTPGADELAPIARRLFAAEREAEALLAERGQPTESRLAIGASTTIGSYLVPELFGQLRRQHPHAQLRLEIGNTKLVQELVRKNEVDLGLTEGLPDAEGLLCSTFAEDELVGIAAPLDPILGRKGLQLSEFLTRPLILRERGSGTRDVLEKALMQQKAKIQASLELGSTEAVKNAVGNRLGVAFVSRLTIELEVRSGRLIQVPLNDFQVHRTLSLVQLPHKSLSQLAHTFLGLLHARNLSRRSQGYAI